MVTPAYPSPNFVMGVITSGTVGKLVNTVVQPENWSQSGDWLTSGIENWSQSGNWLTSGTVRELVTVRGLVNKWYRELVTVRELVDKWNSQRTGHSQGIG